MSTDAPKHRKPAQPAAAAPAREAEAPDPDRDPVGYLLAKGWRPEDGATPSLRCRWLEPGKPDRDIETKVKAFDRPLPNGKTEPVYQTQVTPAAWPLPLAQAVQLQRELDAEQAAKQGAR
jgi:hypothetical protein